MVVCSPGSVEFDARKLTAVGERLGLRMVILFGSRATGSPPPAAESDLDLAVAFSSGHRVSWWDAHRELSAVFPAHVVDLVFLADADALFRWEILGAGVLLLGDPIEHLELRAFAFRLRGFRRSTPAGARALREEARLHQAPAACCGVSSSSASCS